MNPSDLIVICALDLPIAQAVDLLQWYLYKDFEKLHHPSFFWWCKLRQHDVAKRYFLSREN
jgi:hypothetical protein